MAARFCIYCGAKHNEGDLFCYNCGKPVFDMDKFMKENGLIPVVPEEVPVKEEPVEVIPPQPKVEEEKPVQKEEPVEEVQEPEEAPAEEPIQEETPVEEEPKQEEPIIAPVKEEEQPKEEPVKEEARIEEQPHEDTQQSEEQPKVEEPKQEEVAPEEEDRRLGFDGGKIVDVIFTLISMFGLIISFGMRFSENVMPYLVYAGGALFALISFIFSLVRKSFRKDPISRHFYSTFAVLNFLLLLIFLGISAFIVPNLIKNIFPMI